MFQRALKASVVISIVSIAVGAAELGQPPALEDSSEVAISLSFTEPTPVTKIYRAVGKAAGIEVVFDPGVNEPAISTAIAITPTIIRSRDFDPTQLAALWVGTETKIQAPH